MESKWSQDLYIKAFKFAAEVHKDQKIPGSDLPYIVHLALVSMEVMAALSVEDGLDGDLAVQCALLHDVMEDPKVPFEKLESVFKSEVADGVWALTKDDDVGSDIDNEWERKKLRMADSLNKIKEQPKADEIGMVKMADRITNLQPPPSHWTDEKIAYYKKEANLIYNELKDASSFLAERLKRKIEGYKKKKGQESNLKIMDKKEALKILAEYEIEKFKKCLPNYTITDVRPDWCAIYISSGPGDYWYCFPEPSSMQIGSSRVIVISKSTGEIVADGYCGE